MNPPNKGKRTFWIVLAALATALLVTIVLIGPLKLLRQIVIALTEDTEYAPDYSEETFRNIEIGDSEAKVRTALGAPISTYAADPYTEWLYSPDPNPDFATTGIADSTFSHTLILFNEDGHFTGAHGQISHGTKKGPLGVQSSFSMGDGLNTLSLKNAEIAKLKADRATPRQIETQFGKPNATFESRAATWLRYSHSPGSKNYKLRSIGIDRAGKVCRKRSEIYWD